ncbi:MAG TPA: ABC transporter permease [Blastocatellia bacterium]|nr:ABC transporter permease [Blastocatellia bacterium]
MTLLKRIYWRIYGVAFKARIEHEIEEELRLHMKMRADLNLESGMSPDEARRTAARGFGNLGAIKEDCRDIRGGGIVESFLRDLRYGFRTLARSPLFTMVVVLALALGIGASTAVFSAVNAVLLRPLPYRNANRLVSLWEWNNKRGQKDKVGLANYVDFRERATAFEDIGYSWDNQYTITGTGDPESLAGFMLSVNFFSMLDVNPLLGRTFLPDDGNPGADHVVVLSHKLWQRKFAGDPDIVGRTIQLNGEDYTIIGVMPPGFIHPSNVTDLWTPLSLSFAGDGRNLHALQVVALLKHGLSIERAGAEIDSIALQLAAEHPDTNAGWGARVYPIRQLYSGDVRLSLLILQAAVLLVLLITCANVGNLLLARAAARDREVAVRVALGATRARLISQFVAEAMILCFTGAAAGLLLVMWTADSVFSLLPSGPVGVIDTGNAIAWIDGRVLVFALALSIGAAMLFGLAPALGSRLSLAEILKSGTRTATESSARHRLRRLLAVSQIALSLVLLIGAGLMIKSLLKLQGQNLGFRTDHLLAMRLLLPRNRYPDQQRTSAFLELALEGIEAIPGVESAGAVSALPLSGMDARRDFTIAGRADQQPTSARFRVATPQYFRSMGIHLVKGRYFDEPASAGSPEVMIINETLARRYFEGEDPIGRTIMVPDAGTPAPRLIVGVVGNVRHTDFASDPEPEIYRPTSQAYWPFFGLVVRSAGDPAALASSVQNAIWAVDKDEPVDAVMTGDQLAAAALGPRRANTILLTAFGLAALVLATIGIYGVIAYSVTSRTHEIGVRMALGAGRHHVLGMVLLESLVLALIGVALGTAGALATTRFMSSLLFNVGTTDGSTFIALALLVAVVATLAAYIPAHRASLVDPMVALRCE